MHEVAVAAFERATTASARLKLRIGIVVDGHTLPAWQYAMLERLARSSYAALAAAIVIDERGRQAEATRSTAARAVSRVYAFLDRRLHCDPDACAEVDARALLANVPTMSVTAEKAVDALAGLDLDVLVQLGAGAAPQGLADAARFGLWSVYVGDARRGFGMPPGYWEVYCKAVMTESGVRIARADDARPHVVLRSYSATEDISVRLNLNNVYWKSAAFIPRKLEELQRFGPQRFFARVAAQNRFEFADHAPRGEPTAIQAAIQILRTLWRRFTNLSERILRTRPWILLYRYSDDGMATDMASFRKLVAPRDRYWADPFIVVRDGKHHVFFEDYVRPKSKGHISAMILERDGRYSPPQKVLERPYHLSYPFMLEHEGELYMVPETYDNRTVELYRCVEFPHRWTLVETLIENIRATDSTLIFRDGKWWLFANVVEYPGASPWDELCVYYSEKLIGGTWTPHPLNPVVSDVSRSRPAGALFYENGLLYRPSQDCSVRYGYAIRINRVVKLTEEDYEEVEVAAIEPLWDRRLTATHTLNHAEGLTVIDALQPRFRP